MPRSHKKILVTGADVLSAPTLPKPCTEGYNVRSFVLYNSFNSWGWLDRSPQEIRENMDVFSEIFATRTAFKKRLKGCDFVIHLAALICDSLFVSFADTYVDTNIKGTLNVVQAARELGIQRILHTSTSEVYGTARTVPIFEEHPLTPTISLFCNEDRGRSDCAVVLHAFSTPVLLFVHSIRTAHGNRRVL